MNNSLYIAQKFLNAVPRSILVLDFSGKILLANKTACRFIGMSSSNLQGVYINKIQNLISNNAFNLMFKETNKHSYIYFNGMLRRNNGKTLNIQYSANKLKLENKNYILLVITDSTKNIKEHEDLLHRVGFEKLISYATISLNKEHDSNDAVIDILARVGKFSGVDRSYIFTCNQDESFSNTHEWCNKGVKSFIRNLQNINLKEEFPWLYKRLKKFHTIKINNTDLLPKSAATFKREMHRENIASILLMPIYFDKKLFGFMGLDKTNDNKVWKSGDIELLQTISQLFSEIYMKKEQMQQEEKYHHLLESMLIRTLEAIGIMTGEKDFYTARHQARVAVLAATIAKEMQLPLQEIVGIYLGGMVHDIGKISIPSDILNAPRKLSYEEYAIIKTHPNAGYEIIKNVPFIWPITNIVLQHHERLNGSGYPKGLKGN